MIPYLLVGFGAAAISFIATPLVRLFALRIGAIDHPHDRKVHANPTPTLGGLAIFLAILGAGVVARFMPEFANVFEQSSQPLGIALGAIVIFALGAVDDLRSLPAPVKLAGQVFASGIMFLAGVKMRFVLLPNGEFYGLGDDVSVLVTVIWLVAMINAVNLVDGLDGLAAGIVAIAGASFFVFVFRLSERGLLPDESSAPLLAIVVVGAALGFLRHNFHPARIFMGDSGSMLLGLVLGATTLVGIGSVPATLDLGLNASSAAPSTSAAQVFLAYFPLLIPIMVIALPIADTVFAILRRAARRRSIFRADKEHLHHRLMDLGHGHRQAVIVMYIWSALAAGAALAFTFLDSSNVIFALPIAVGAIVLYTLFPVLTKAIQDRLSWM